VRSDAHVGSDNLAGKEGRMPWWGSLLAALYASGAVAFGFCIGAHDLFDFIGVLLWPVSISIVCSEAAWKARGGRMRR